MTELKPLQRFLFTIGELPTSYLMSMTYFEQLTWLCNFITKEVIPKYNDNVEAIAELQELYVELKSYVDNYFDNLDVQAEINNKLDDMSDKGQLQEIIDLYLRANCVLGYQTKNELKNATNIVEGSICKTLGNITYNDGYGNYYIIRTLTSSDIVDEDNILSLTISNTLIAEKIDNKRFNDIKDIIGNLNNLNTADKSNIVNAINEVLNKKQDKLTEMVLFGDSWTDPTSLDAIWGNLIGTELNLSVHNYALSGCWLSETNTTSLEAQITTFENSSVNKDLVKYVVILGGINDFRGGVTWIGLYEKIVEQVNRLKLLVPNAKIVYVSNCRYYYDKEQGDYWCGVHQAIRCFTSIVTYNMFGTMGQEMFNTNNYFHLTQTGQKLMMSNIIATLTGGELQYWQDDYVTENTDAKVVMSTQRVQNMVMVKLEITAKTAFTSTTLPNKSGIYFPYYPQYAGWSDKNFVQFAFDLTYNSLLIATSSAVRIGQTYHHSFMIPLYHQD